MMRSLCLVLSFVFVASISYADEAKELEAVRLVDLSQTYEWTGSARTAPTTTQIVIAVSSSGCTEEKDFEIRTQLVGDTQRVSFVRKNPDRCKAMSREKRLSFTVEDLKLSNFFPIILENPVMGGGVEHQPGERMTVE